AREVHLRITSPPFLHPCYYGTDIKSRDSLIACKLGVPEMLALFCADSLGYLSLEAVSRIAAPIPPTDFCLACFNGRYPTRAPEASERERYFKRLVRVGETV
ncbi:MAG: amidophosphoribosyltransferase, partial [Clostridiales bacterium]|nr:amidophosphoribosyltransferase [Clostridiales bacterium]